MSIERKKYVLVTGASSGIGFVTAIEFAKRGYYVFAGARRLEAMRELEAYGIRIVQLDVSSTESIKELKKLILEETGGYLDMVYNNAGQSCTFPALDVTDELFKQCFEVNVYGPIRIVRELGPYVINAKGVIGFTGSVSGVIPFPFSCIYSASKAAIHQYAATLRIEMKPFDVKVINIVTGGVNTNISDKRDLDPNSIYNFPEMEQALEERRKMAVKNHPMDPKIYAKKVVNDFERAKINGSLNIYRGTMASFLGYVLCWCPRFIVELALFRSFKLKKPMAILGAKYSKEKME